MVGSFYDPVLDEGCAFEELISFHGGLGGPQTRAVHPAPAQPAAAGRADRRRGRRPRRALGLAPDAAGPGRLPAARRRALRRRSPRHPGAEPTTRPPSRTTTSSTSVEALGAVRDEQHGAVAGRGEDVVQEPRRGGRVEVGGRLVEHEHGGVGEQRPGEPSRWRWPPESSRAVARRPSVSQPVRQRRTQAPRRARRSASSTAPRRSRPGRASRTFSRMRRREQVGVLAGERDRSAGRPAGA